MSATMVDLAQTSRDPLQAGVAEMFLMYSDPMKYITYRTIGDMRVAMSRFATLPSVSSPYRAINGSYGEGTGTFEQLEEDLSIIGHDIDIDLELEGNRTQMIPQEEAQVDGTMKALTYKMNNDLVNGDRAVDPLGVDGIKVRVGNLAARQTIAGDPAAPTDSLKIYTSAATMNTFLDGIDQAIDCLDGGVCDLILADEAAVRGWFSVVRRIGASAGVVDIAEFVIGDGVQNMPFIKLGTKRIPIAYTGFTDETQATHVITTTEATGDGGTDGTSVYFLRLGDKYFSGLQKRAMRTKKFDELEASPQKRIRVDWVYGYSNWNDRSIVRHKNLKFGT